ncbi:MAG TPA: tetratricopeptide repeat protein [Planctomycetota bacterium]|nr:tetratricopeptide repeat protein [Planctomycetota bacterium]
MKRFAIAALMVGLVEAGCAGQESTGALPEGRFPGMGAHHRAIGTKSTEAQAWFDQGLNFLYAFNHDEAIRSFEKAADIDPTCAMAAWGVSLANGPHINNPMVDEAHAKAAWKWLARARELSGGASAVEKALIDALGKRYADPQPEDRSGLDKAYAAAMREVRKSHPKDADGGALFAEALMDTRPWDLWTVDGKPQPETPEIVAVLEETIRLDPKHPLALHLYIHAVEASPDPGRADAAADTLRTLTPGLGHLVHMPSHIDVRRGRWEAAVTANKIAMASDAAYINRAKPPGFYRLYMAHNHHMLAFASMMRGESRQATESLKSMIAGMPEEFLAAFAPLVDGFLASPFEVHLRFGRWEEMLKEPEPKELFPLSRALWRFARAVSYAALGKTAEARDEQKKFGEARGKVAKEATFGNNAAADLMAVAEKMMDGEILYREGKETEAFAMLRDAVVREDALRYDEPPDWIQPVRHTLGAALLRSGKPAEAEEVYKEDLKHWPNNGWSLFGLSRSLGAQGRKPEAAEVEAQFKEVWKNADLPITSSCLCLPESK